MDTEIRHRLAMVQLVQPREEVPATPPVEPELTMPYTDRETYFEAFRRLEEKMTNEATSN